MKSEHISESFQSLMKDTKNGYLRGVELGFTLEQLHETEGTDGIDRQQRGLVYERKSTENEKVLVLYELTDNKVSAIQIEYSYNLLPSFEALNLKDDISKFIFADKKLDQLQTPVLKIRDQFVKHFTNKMGDPEIEYKGRDHTKRVYHQWFKEVGDIEEVVDLHSHFEFNNEHNVYRQELIVNVSLF